jgi:L-lactate utilization protein LutC
MQHPNVYTHKLQFQIPESEQENLSLTWDAALSLMNEQIRNQEQKATLSSNAESSLADTGSVILASKTRLALDQQLNASGFS